MNPVNQKLTKIIVIVLMGAIIITRIVVLFKGCVTP